MVGSIYGAPERRCNDIGATLSAPGTSPSPHSHSHPDLVGYPYLGPDEQAALLAAVDATGDIAIGDLVRVLPDHPAPLGAVLALVDKGRLGLDLDSPFDASCRVWRIAREPLG